MNMRKAELILEAQLIIAASLLFASAGMVHAETGSAAPLAAVDEEFQTLDQWRPKAFPKIDRHSNYAAVTLEDGTTALKASSSNSASALLLRSEFDIRRYPILTFSWRAESVYRNGDGTLKSGDDYPIRIYVAFRFDPEKAGFAERAKYRAAKLLHGQYPPHSTINYVWGNRKPPARIITSPYTERAKIIFLDWGSEHTGNWRSHTLNVLDDYRAAFGEDPPSSATLAVMNDSDNTGESSVSYIDYLRLEATPASANQSE